MRNPILTPGTPAPWFKCRTLSHDAYTFHTAAGRHIVLCFFGSAGEAENAAVLKGMFAKRDRFNDRDLSFFGISTDPEDERQQRIADSFPGIRFICDTDNAVSGLYGAAQPDGAYQKLIYLLDPALRILAALPFPQDAEGSLDALLSLLDSLPKAGAPYRAAAQAPVLVLPRVFEPALCQALVDYYDKHGGRESGFMRDIDGKTTALLDPSHKRRRDCTIEDQALQAACMERIRLRLAPEIHKAFQFQATRVERQIVACYDAEEQGHFRAHRDNTTKGTAHRRFAVSLFLNNDYEGGMLRFPEFGPALYRAQRGGAVVFSCSLLHEATPVTRGRRYMYLPFLYDEEGRQVRLENLKHLESDANDPGRAPTDDNAGSAEPMVPVAEH